METKNTIRDAVKRALNNIATMLADITQKMANDVAACKEAHAKKYADWIRSAERITSLIIKFFSGDKAIEEEIAEDHPPKYKDDPEAIEEYIHQYIKMNYMQ